MKGEEVLTIEVKLNGRIIAEADLTNRSGLAQESDYSLRWIEYGDDEMGTSIDNGRTIIERHRLKQSVWLLAAKAACAILKHKIDALEPRP